MSAIFSECGTYRYLLTRPGDVHAEKGTALFLMLNPSTADATEDDPTIRRCRNFARAWGCNGIAVANLYALRATDPAELWKHPDPVGPDNDWRLKSIAREYTDIVCAWGANARSDRVTAVTSILTAAGGRLWCLGTTKDGHPRHPLYVRSDQPLIPWTLPSA
ncbi:DUF1643 domain-containing protein [Pseudomonas sp. BN417]|uniref:DUF1643 domain-containing protein n=1 Tax=Pseudomonas sp. BN417 TaxID=2567890 RepID=UPI00245521B8|nr:DUF1643 domain-containing protein [Pseudomonas sp. BN417]MDH4555683.1 DUF1643 domain-containing protein [Pseudomonas sp. BN417]